MERWIERVLFASRWLMAPLYLGLAALLVLFVLRFAREFIELAAGMASVGNIDLIIAALTLVDLVLVASLIVMVMLSGFENFVSKINVTAAEERLSWLMKLDTGSIKVKLAGSIVAISVIDLLKVFLDIQHIADDKLPWLVIMHLTFVVTALALAALDRISGARGGH